MTTWTLILVAWCVLAVLMAALWLIQKRTHNGGIVDVAWSFGTGLTAVWFAWGADGDPARRWLIAVVAGLWGARLGLHLLRRVTSEAEDGRYAMLREKWGNRTQLCMFVFFQIQAAWGVLFALPMLIAARNDTPGLQWFDYSGAVVWLIAVAGEAIADAQLARFRRRPESKGKVCRDGLWRYSRHPNYFFEWVHWWAYVLISVGAPLWWLTLAGPSLMLFFLLKVTGIPMTEQRALLSRGDAYREYQATTNRFFPGPPRERQADAGTSSATPPATPTEHAA